jgi:hypothetical protein
LIALATSADAVTPGVAIVDVLPIRGTSVTIVVQRNPHDLKSPILQLIRKEDLPNEHVIGSGACGFGQNGRAPSLVVENTTDRNLTVTVFEPSLSPAAAAEMVKGKTPEEAKKAIDTAKKTKCLATCSIKTQDYDSLCTFGDIKATCQPKPQVALCNSPECMALRSAECKTLGCSVDLIRVVESCGCSVSKPLAASVAAQRDSQSATAPDSKSAPAMKIDLISPTSGTLTVDPAGRSTYGNDLGIAAMEVGRKTGIQIVSSEYAKSTLKEPNPAVRFDAAIFSNSDGLANIGETYQIRIDDAGPSSAAPVSSTNLDWTVGGSDCLRPTAAPLMRVAVVPLDDTGVASWRYLNPRNPACINCDPSGKALQASDTGPSGVAFRNRTFDRTFSVSFTLPAGAKLTDADEATFQCQAGKDCVISRAIPPQNTMLFDIRLFAGFTKSPIRFDVSLLGESATLANSRAYLSLGPALDVNGKPLLDERPSLSPLKTKVTLAGRIDPDLPAVPAKLSDPPEFTPCNSTPAKYDPTLEPVLCANHVYDEKEIQQYTAKGTLQITPNLGDRADASATLAFRSGTLGTAIDKVGIDEYQVNIYGVNGLSLKFGKSDFAVPSNRIAIAESGEGFLYSYQNFSLGHLLRRESRTGTADFRNRDKKDWWVQLRSMSLGQRWRDRAEAEEKPERPPLLLTFFRSFDAIALIGKDKEANSTYRTIGGEIFFARPGTAPDQTTDAATTSVYNIFGGSLAAYRSSRNFRSSANCLRPEAAPLLRCSDGRGTVALLSATWTPRIDVKPGKSSSTPQTFSVAVGVGSGDKPGTGVDESYIGESSSFAPDKLFLASFVAKMNTDKVTFVSPGLSNKRYLALTYTNNERTLFDLVASLLGVDGDVNSRTTIIALRDYRLRYPRNNSRSAAREAGATFQIEVPKGITFTLDSAYLLRGDAFKDLIPHRGWSIGASVSLSL